MYQKPAISIKTATDCQFLKRLTIKGIIALILFTSHLSLAGQDMACRKFYEPKTSAQSSFNEVLNIMQSNPYKYDKLPVIPIRIWKFIGKRLSFFVGKRSQEILVDTRDYRQTPMEKPIHSMGVGLVGSLKMYSTQWSGVFAGGEFSVLARASISQGNPFKTKPDGTPQKRSTAMALKIFDTKNHDKKTTTANAVFQNDLNGLLAADRTALNFLDSSQTNNPNVDLTKIQYSYELLTLLGVAAGAIKNPKDHSRQFPFINPQIRPVHSLAELGVADPELIKTPTWLKIQPRKPAIVVEESDFRLEIARTLEQNEQIIYDVYASDFKSPDGEIQWVPVGVLSFDRAILAEGVDQNMLFHHDSLNSKRSGKPFEIPKPSKQYQPIPEDIQ